MKNIALLGFGTVGQGVYEILEDRREKIESLTGEPFQIKYILVHDLKKKRNISPTVELTDDLQKILNDSEVDVIVELTGTDKLALHAMLTAMEHKKAVVTANKSVVSKHFYKLYQTSIEENMPFIYEASVGGGIPIIKPLKEEVLINEISSIEGILNGTCNYILTQMFEKGLDYKDVLKQAQELGYAEADPTSDVEGFDTQRKLRILSTIAFNEDIKEEEIAVSGISSISKFDVDYCKKNNYTIKLLATAKRKGKEFTATVEPTLISRGDYFDFVNDAYNSVSFEGNHIDKLKFYGAGAGKFPTGDAVVRDIVDILLNHTTVELKQKFMKRTLINVNQDHRFDYYVRSAIALPFDHEEANGQFFHIIKNTTRHQLESLLKQQPKDSYFIAKIGY